MEVIDRKDYNQSIKINSRDIKCYDKKKLKELYPNGNYSVVGETFESNKKEKKDTIILGGKELIVSPYGENSAIVYKRKGYLLVGENQFIVILQNRLAFLLIFIALVSIGIGIAILGYNILKKAPVVAPDYPLPPEDANSRDIKVDRPDSTGTTHSNHASIKVAREVIFNLNTKEGNFVYQNFNASNKDAVVTICVLKDDNEYVIARSGLVKSGKEIKKIRLLDDAINLTQGVYKGRIKVDFYDETTGEKAATSTDFDDIEITVK